MIVKKISYAFILFSVFTINGSSPTSRQSNSQDSQDYELVQQSPIEQVVSPQVEQEKKTQSEVQRLKRRIKELQYDQGLKYGKYKVYAALRLNKIKELQSRLKGLDLAYKSTVPLLTTQLAEKEIELHQSKLEQANIQSKSDQKVAALAKDLADAKNCQAAAEWFGVNVDKQNKELVENAKQLQKGKLFFKWRALILQKLKNKYGKQISAFDEERKRLAKKVDEIALSLKVAQDLQKASLWHAQQAKKEAESFKQALEKERSNHAATSAQQQTIYVQLQNAQSQIYSLKDKQKSLENEQIKHQWLKQEYEQLKREQESIQQKLAKLSADAQQKKMSNSTSKPYKTPTAVKDMHHHRITQSCGCDSFMPLFNFMNGGAAPS